MNLAQDRINFIGWFEDRKQANAEKEPHPAQLL
jgi:hypothetical protein